MVKEANCVPRYPFYVFFKRISVKGFETAGCDNSRVGLWRLQVQFTEYQIMIANSDLSHFALYNKVFVRCNNNVNQRFGVFCNPSGLTDQLVEVEDGAEIFQCTALRLIREKVAIQGTTGTKGTKRGTTLLAFVDVFVRHLSHLVVLFISKPMIFLIVNYIYCRIQH